MAFQNYRRLLVPSWFSAPQLSELWKPTESVGARVELNWLVGQQHWTGPFRPASVRYRMSSYYSTTGMPRDSAYTRKTATQCGASFWFDTLGATLSVDRLAWHHDFLASLLGHIFARRPAPVYSWRRGFQSPVDYLSRHWLLMTMDRFDPSMDH